MNRQGNVFQSVEKLYLSSGRKMGRWMWEHHVQWVMERGEQLAQKYQADVGMVTVAALLHDLGDVWLERTDPYFDTRSEDEAKLILKEAGYDVAQIDSILTDIIAPHSCYPDNLPQTLEAKVLATADALFHLETDFYVQFAFMNIPAGKSYAEWIAWAREKVERDYEVKVFFEDEKKQIYSRYEALRSILKG